MGLLQAGGSRGTGGKQEMRGELGVSISRSHIPAPHGVGHGRVKGLRGGGPRAALDGRGGL